MQKDDEKKDDEETPDEDGGTDENPDVLELAEGLQLASLDEACKNFFEIDDLDNYEDHIPGWKGQRAKRGLKEWHSTDLCATVVNNAIAFYTDTIGIPPVVSGKHHR